MTLENASAGTTWSFSSSGNANTYNGGPIRLAGVGNGSFGPVISGTTAVQKSGNGTWTLTGANTYSGATTVNAGTLKAGVASVANVSGAFGNNSAVTMANISGMPWTSPASTPRSARSRAVGLPAGM